MIELFTVLLLLDRWIGTPVEVRRWFKSDRTLRAVRVQLEAGLGRRNPQAAIDYLQSLDYAQEALRLLSAEGPPGEYAELKYVLFKAGITLHGRPIHGMMFLEEVMSRLQVLYLGARCLREEDTVFDLIRGASEVAVLTSLCKRHTLESTVTNEFGTHYRERLEAWRTAEIWSETCQADVYQRYQDGVFKVLNSSLETLSKQNMEGLLGEYHRMQPDEAELLILDRFMHGRIYFKHATFSAQVIRNSGVMLCPELSISDGVSARNETFKHNKYVFGRMEFTDLWWDSRFGDERILFEIQDLGDAISLSLHDQAQPFARSAGALIGHTQEIKFDKVTLRGIPGDRNQQNWTQYYDVGVQHANSFVQEVFVGQEDCRQGMALSLIRELRRMGRRNEEEKEEEEGGRAYQAAAHAFKARIVKVLKNKDDQGFQDIFKQFFRVEIRVPAYIDLTAMRTLRHLSRKKRVVPDVFPDFAGPVHLPLERSAIHRALVQASLCVQLSKPLNAQPMLDLVRSCVTPLCDYVLRSVPLALDEKELSAALEVALEVARQGLEREQAHLEASINKEMRALFKMLTGDMLSVTGFTDCRNGACAEVRPGANGTLGHVRDCPSCGRPVAISFRPARQLAMNNAVGFARWLQGSLK